MKQVTAVVIGAGQRGADVYAAYALHFPNELKIVGVAEPLEDRRAEFAALHGIPEERCFETWEDLLQGEKIADCALVCTQDKMHYGPVMRALDLGYDVLCEKPMSPDRDELLAMGQKAADTGRLLSIAHVLRYSPFFMKIKELIDEGAVGELVSVQHIESVGYWHMAHSFVRGNWRRAGETSPMILAKCCHDMDILLWLVGSRCKSVSSFGSLKHFRREKAPKGAPKHCLDGCAHRDSCPYYAPRFYLEHPRADVDGFTRAVSLDTSAEALLEALKKGPYGRCVYRCDNDVVDHQVVNLEFENGVTAGMEMSAFTKDCERVINIMGSKGQIRGNMEENRVVYDNFVDGSRVEYSIHTPAGGHGGSDVTMMRDFVSLIAEKGKRTSRSSAAASIESHLMSLAAEKSRESAGVPVLMESWRKTKDACLYKNAKKPENIPTYDGSGQATHPSVVRFEKPWHGYKYWMAMTPYPFNNDGLEDPSILASHDGRKWVVPEGAENPLVPAPEIGHNCDVELIYEPSKDELRIYYVEADDVKQSWVKMLRSKDGVHWGKPTVVLHDPDYMYSILSPAIVRYPDGNYQMWYVDTGNTGYRNQNNLVKTRKSKDGIHWGRESVCESFVQPGYQIWHMTVSYDPQADRWLAIYPAYPNGTNCDYCKLFMAEKIGDGPWQARREPIMETGDPGAWDDFCLYRTSFLLDGDRLTLWYGGKKKEDSSWGIARITGRLPKKINRER